MAVIYRITNMVSDKYYIGSAESFEKRKWQHLSDLKRGAHKNPHLQAAWNCYGEEAFVFEVIEVVPDGRSAFDIENTYLHKCVGQPDCYNVNTDAVGMRTGIPHSAATKQKMRLKVQAALAEGRGGKFIPSEDTRAKMSAAALGNTNARGYRRTEAECEVIRQRARGNKNFLGKNHTEATKDKLRRPLLATLPDGSHREFVGVSAAGVELGVVYQMVLRAAKARKPISSGALAGWFFTYRDEAIPAPVIPERYAHLPRTRQLAREQGATTYFTGLPCSKGHIAPRKTKGTCIECLRIEWATQNKKRAEKIG